jgi:hypothetical protein
MPEKMPERDATFLEAESLKVARRQLGCHDLREVRIGPLKPPGSGRNWEVLGFKPDLPKVAKELALRAIDEVRGKYALAPRRKG